MLYLILLAVVVPTLFIGGLVLLAGRRRSVTGDSDSDSLSFVGGVLNAIFTVLLAFYIVFAWQNGDDIETSSAREADSLVDAYWQATAIPAPEGPAIQSLATRYASRVVDREWAALNRGESDPGVNRILTEMRVRTLSLPTEEETLKSSREQILNDIREIDTGHRKRVSKATHDDTFTDVLLVGSILGALLMVAFPILIGLRPTVTNLTSMVLLTITLGCTLYLSVELLHPLDGPFAIEPDAFSSALHSLSQSPRDR